MRWFKRRSQRGQGLVEYALILFLVAIVVITALALIGSNVGSLYTSIAAAI
jgi:pilus assembly protein Flp/PilA